MPRVRRKRPGGGEYTDPDAIKPSDRCILNESVQEDSGGPSLRRPRQRGRNRGPLNAHVSTEEKRRRELEKQKREVAADMAQLVLDLTGILDPTPVSDGTNALISLARGKWTDALISGVSLIPYIGDLAKVAKLPRYLNTIRLAKKIAAYDLAWRNALKDIFKNLKPLLDKVDELGTNTLPTRAKSWLKQIQLEVDSFLGMEKKGGVGEVGAVTRTGKVSTPSSVAKMDGSTVSSGDIGNKTKTGVAADQKTVTIYRVDDDGFDPRISRDGSIPNVTTKKGNERALFVNIDQPKRAKEFALVNRKGNATITAVEADASILEKLRESAVHDLSPDAKLKPTSPLKVDINKAPDQYGLRTKEQIQMLRDAIDPSTVRIVDPKDL